MNIITFPDFYPQPPITPPELTPFLSPSLLRKEGEYPWFRGFYTPLFAKQRGGRGIAVNLRVSKIM
jgi:hypothetical protein